MNGCNIQTQENTMKAALLLLLLLLFLPLPCRLLPLLEEAAVFGCGTSGFSVRQSRQTEHQATMCAKAPQTWHLVLTKLLRRLE